MVTAELSRIWPIIGTRRALLLILVVALLVRLPGLDRDVWADEAWSLFSARGVDATKNLVVNGPEITSAAFWQDGGWSEVLQAVAHSEGTPPLYFLALRIWLTTFGESNRTSRFLSLLFGIAAIAAIFFLGRRLWDEKLGLIAAGVLALLPLHIQYSQEIRPYSMAVLLVTLASWAYWTASQQMRQCGEWKYWLLYSGLVSASLYVHPFTMGTFLAHFLFVFFQPRSRRVLLLGRLLACAGVSLVLLAPWFVSYYFEAQLELVGAVSNKVPFGGSEALKRIGVLMGQLVAGYVPNMRFASVLGVTLLSLYATTMAVPFSAARQGNQRAGVIFGVLLLIMPILFFLGITAASREIQLVYLFPRYVIPAATGLSLLLALTMTLSRWRALRLMILLMLLVVCVHFHIKWHQANRSSSPLPGFQWFYGTVSAAVTELNRIAKPGDLILFEGQHLQLIWNVYDRSNVAQLVLDRKKGLTGKEPSQSFDSRWQEMERTHSSVYYIGRMNAPPNEVTRRLDERYRLVSSKRVGRLEISHYIKPIPTMVSQAEPR